ncbi:MAG: sigma-70 family RNA polymerase sigma factor [Anaerosomatales bacterium]|nr:sigma-70 family RNA polymerase sigma factor [Anaerosomatales bacterium]
MDRTGANRESDLVARAQAGDERAFEDLVRAHADAVYGHALRFFGDPSAAEDATQEVFIKVYRSIGSFDGRSAFSTWLFRVTRNVCLDIARSRTRTPVPTDLASFDPPRASDASDAVVLAHAVEAAVRTLPPEEREALGAIALFGLSYEQAADALGVPAGTVKSRVFRARKALAVLLTDSGGGA